MRFMGWIGSWVKPPILLCRAEDERGKSPCIRRSMVPRNEKAPPGERGSVVHFIGAGERSRTLDLRITNPLQISYLKLRP